MSDAQKPEAVGTDREVAINAWIAEIVKKAREIPLTAANMATLDAAIAASGSTQGEQTK